MPARTQVDLFRRLKRVMERTNKKVQGVLSRNAQQNGTHKWLLAGTNEARRDSERWWLGVELQEGALARPAGTRGAAVRTSRC